MPYPDGEPTNEERAERVRLLCVHYQTELIGEAEYEGATFDDVACILADIRHWCRIDGSSFGDLLERSRKLFEEELPQTFRDTVARVKIYGYDVELVFFEEGGEQRNYCHITSGNYVASLEVLQQYGILNNSEDDSELPVEPTATAAILRWALDNGY